MATAAALEKLFIFAVMWSIGAILELEDRALMQNYMMSHESKFTYPALKEGETIFEYVVSDSGNVNT